MFSTETAIQGGAVPPRPPPRAFRSSECATFRWGPECLLPPQMCRRGGGMNTTRGCTHYLGPPPPVTSRRIDGQTEAGEAETNLHGCRTLRNGEAPTETQQDYRLMGKLMITAGAPGNVRALSRPAPVLCHLQRYPSPGNRLYNLSPTQPQSCMIANVSHTGQVGRGRSLKRTPPV